MKAAIHALQKARRNYLMSVSYSKQYGSSEHVKVHEENVHQCDKAIELIRNFQKGDAELPASDNKAMTAISLMDKIYHRYQKMIGCDMLYPDLEHYLVEWQKQHHS